MDTTTHLTSVIAAADARARLAEISTTAVSDLTDEDRSERERLLNEMPDLERQAAAAMASQDAALTVEPEARSADVQGLVERADVGEVFTAATEHRSTTGATAELQAEAGVAPHVIPLAMLEDRAITPAPADTQGNQSAILGQVFPRASAMMSLGVTQPTVPTGEDLRVILSSETSATKAAESATVDETTGAFTTKSLEPVRIQASFFYSREDAARLVGMGEALRQNLTESLGSAWDREAIAAVIAGVTGSDINATGSSAWGNLQGLIYDASILDGKFAASAADLRLLVGPATLAKLGTLLRSASDPTSSAEWISSQVASLRTSAHIPAVASKKQAALIRKGTLPAAVGPVWEGVTLIPDEVTKAATGEIVITAVMLANWAVLRAGGFAQRDIQLTA